MRAFSHRVFRLTNRQVGQARCGVGCSKFKIGESTTHNHSTKPEPILNFEDPTPDRTTLIKPVETRSPSNRFSRRETTWRLTVRWANGVREYKKMGSGPQMSKLAGESNRQSAAFEQPILKFEHPTPSPCRTGG